MGRERVVRLIAAGCDNAGERLLRRTSTMLALSVAGIFALSSGVAQAEPPKLVSFGNFGAGLADRGIGVGVDQSSSDVYVAGLFNINGSFEPAHVKKFDASGKLLVPPSPFGGAYYSGTAVNPTNGDVYVLGENEFLGSASVYSYDPNTGEPLSSFPVPVSRNFSVFTAVQIATDAAGNVYVPNVPGNSVEEYSPAGALLQTFTGSVEHALSKPTGVAVDSSGNVWVTDATGTGRIEEFSPADVVIGEIKSEGVQAVAVDTHGGVFAVVENSADFCGSLPPPCTHLVQYSAAGVQLADIGAGSIGVESAKEPSMLAVNNASGRVYVTDPLNDRVWIYGPPFAPVLGSEFAADRLASPFSVREVVRIMGRIFLSRFGAKRSSARS